MGTWGMGREAELFDSVPDGLGRDPSLVQRATTMFFRSRTRLRREAEDSRISHEDAQLYFLKKEVAEARAMIAKLEQKCEAAQSYREKSSKLLEEALRALGRLEQAMLTKDCQGLILAASEIKASVQQGLTLINVYGKYSTLAKVATIVIRKSIYSKYDQVTEKLTSLVTVAVPQPPSGVVQPANINASSETSNATIARVLGRSSTGTGNKAAGKDAASSKDQPQASGQVIKQARHEKIYCMAYVPQAVGGSYINLWWSTGNMLEFWSEADGSTTAFPVDKDTQSVTCIAIDHNGSIWTGYMKGLVRARQRGRWDWPAEEKSFSTQIRVISFDERGYAWIGDSAGKIKVLRHIQPGTVTPTTDGGLNVERLSSVGGHSATASLTGSYSTSDRSTSKSRLEVVATLQESAWSKMAAGAKSMFIPSIKSVLTGKSPCKSHKSDSGKMKDVMSSGPIRCIYVRDGRAWIGGGQTHCTPWLALFDANTFTSLDVWICHVLGGVNAMRPIEWPQQTVTACRPDQSGNGGACVLTELASASWRLLTGHENGQLLVWHPRNDKLSPIIRIGEPMSPIKGIQVLEDLSLVITAHQNGELHMFVQQRVDKMLPPGSDSAHPDSLGTVRPKKMIIKAHKTSLAAIVGARSWFATASTQGTIRVWQAADVASDAERAGLVAPDRQSTLSTSMSAGSSQARQPSTAATLSAAGNTGTLNRVSRQDAVEPAANASSSSSGGVGRTRSDATDNLDVAPRQGSMPSTSQPPTSGGSAATAATATTTDTNRPQFHGVRRNSSVGASDMNSPAGAPLEHAGTPHAAFTSACQTIDASELALRKLIGAGAYGKVWLAEWTGCAVAVKELMGFSGSDDDAKLWAEMQNEVHMLGTYNHPNVVRFVGVCCDPPMIVMQYYPHGSMFDLLQRARKNNARAVKELAWQKRLDMLKDVAAGMHYLHTRKPAVIHGDLRSPNLLLDLTIDRERPRFHVKIADFGLARMLHNSSVIMVSKTTNPRWTAPEVIKYSQIGPAGDVYSFSIIMWELLTWQQPYADMMSVQVILRTVTDHDRPIIPPDHVLPGNPGVTLKDYKALMERCWAPNAADRPSFKEIVDAFQAMRDIEARAARSGSGANTPNTSTPTSRMAATANVSLVSATGNGSASPFANSTGEPTSSNTPLVMPINGSAANSGSSIKSDTATALVGIVPAKDSASSMAADAYTLGGKMGNGTNQAGAAGLPGGAAAPRGGFLWGSGGAMSPIVEERSLSLDSHSVATNPSHTLPHAHQQGQHQPTTGMPPVTATIMQGPAVPVPAHIANMSPFASPTPPDMVSTPSEISRLFGPVNLLDGDDGTDPLEAYRSGALEEFNYSFLNNPASMIFPTVPTLGRVVEESELEKEAAASRATSMISSPQDLPSAQPSGHLVMPADDPVAIITRNNSLSLAGHMVPRVGPAPIVVPPAARPARNPFAQAAASFAGAVDALPAYTAMQHNTALTAPGKLQESQMAANSSQNNRPIYEKPNSPQPLSTSPTHRLGTHSSFNDRSMSPTPPHGRVAHRSTRSHDILPDNLTLPPNVSASQDSLKPRNSLGTRDSGGMNSPARQGGSRIASPAASGRGATHSNHGSIHGSASAHPSRFGQPTHSRTISAGAGLPKRPSDPVNTVATPTARGMPPRAVLLRPKNSNNTPGGSRHSSPQRASSASHLALEVQASGGSATSITSGRGRSNSATSQHQTGKPGSAMARGNNAGRPAFGSSSSSRIPPRQPPSTTISRTHQSSRSQQSSAPGSPGASSTCSAARGASRHGSPSPSSSGRVYSTDLCQAHSGTAVAGDSDADVTPHSSANRTSPMGPGRGPVMMMMSRMDSIPQPPRQPQGRAPTGTSTVARPYAPLTPYSPFAANMEPWPSSDDASMSQQDTASVDMASQNGSLRTDRPRDNPPAAAATDPTIPDVNPASCDAYAPSAISMPDVSPHRRDAHTPTTSDGAVNTSYLQQGEKYYTLSAYSPFASTTQQQGPSQPETPPLPVEAPMACMMTVIPEEHSQGKELYYSPLSKFSPFSAVAGNAADDSMAAEKPQTDKQPKVMVSCSEASPVAASSNTVFSNAPAQHTHGTASDKYYAPLSKFSPFASFATSADTTTTQQTSHLQDCHNNGNAILVDPQQARPVETSTAKQQGVQTSDGKPYAPLTAYSPFAAAPFQADTGSDLPIRVYAPLTASSPFSAAAVQTAEPAGPTVISDNAGQVVKEKYYAPLSAFSPFSGAAAAAWD